MEEWKWIHGYINIYTISNLGRIYSYKTKQFKCLSEDKDGYLWTMLHGNGKPKKKFLHTLLLETFVGPRPTPKHVVRHYPDQNKKNNSLDNLSWDTPATNARDRYEENHDNAKFTEYDIINIKNDLLSGNYTQADICRKYKMCRENISKIVANETWKDIGPDLSLYNFDKRRILSKIDVSKIKKAISMNHNPKKIRLYFNISWGVYTNIKKNKTFINVNECNNEEYLKFKDMI